MNLKKKKKKNVGNVNQTMAHIVVIYSLSNHLLTFSCFFPHAFNFQFSWLLPCTFFLFSWPIWLWYLFMFPFLILFHASASHVGNKGINYLVTLCFYISLFNVKKKVFETFDGIWNGNVKPKLVNLEVLMYVWNHIIYGFLSR